jgi:hypothetical protein
MSAFGPNTIFPGSISSITGDTGGAVISVGGDITIQGSGIVFSKGSTPGLLLATVTGAVVWSVITASTPGVQNNGYIANAASLVQVSLPTTATVGSCLYIARNLNASGSWSITQSAGQQILCGSLSTMLGSLGSLSSTKNSDAITLVCVTANTIWSVLSMMGNPTII